MKRMSNGKKVAPEKIPIEAWKSLGDRGNKWHTNFFNKIMSSKRMSDE